MATLYEMMLSVGLDNKVSAGLLAIGNQLSSVHALATKIGTAFGGWRGAIALAGTALVSSALFKGLEDIAKAGSEVNKQLENMKVAGFSAAEMQQAMAAATKTSGSVLTTNLSENLKHLNELRFAFGETTQAIAHLDELSKANSVLNRLRNGGTDEVWALVKSLEGKGLTFDSKEFSKYLDAMTKVVSATGGRVTPEMFRSTFQYGRTATLGWNDEFIGGALGRLIQESTRGGGGGGSGGPGNALMSVFSAVVSGQMKKTAAEEFARMGLGTARHIAGSSESQISGQAGRDLFIANPYEWVQKVLMPALKAHGITSEKDIIAQLGKMFGVRTASDMVAKMALQGRFREGADSPFEKDIRLNKGAMGAIPAYDELMKNDVAMNIEAFHKQWTNLMEVLGSDLMKPGGPVVQALAGVTSAMGKLGQFAAAHPDAINTIVAGLGGLAVALAALAAGGVLIAVAALLPGGVIAAGIIGLGTAIGAIVALNWAALTDAVGAMQRQSTIFADAMLQLALVPYNGIVAGIESVKNALLSMKDWFGSLKGWFDPHNFLPKKSSFEMDGTGGGAKLMPAHFNPGSQRMVVIPITTNLNIDGRALAQEMGGQFQDLHTFPTQSGSPNYWAMWPSPDAARSHRTS